MGTNPKYHQMRPRKRYNFCTQRKQSQNNLKKGSLTAHHFLILRSVSRKLDSAGSADKVHANSTWLTVRVTDSVR